MVIMNARVGEHDFPAQEPIAIARHQSGDAGGGDRVGFLIDLVQQRFFK